MYQKTLNANISPQRRMEEDSVARTPCFDQLPFLLRPRGPDRALLLYECTRQLLVVSVFVIDFYTEAQSCTGREYD